MTKLEAFVNHYAMWDKIVHDTPHYRQIKEFYPLSHGGRVFHRCYLCQFYEADCDKCPLKTCGIGSLYEKFTKYRSPCLAILIRNIIFKEYKDDEILHKLKAYCNHYAMWDNIVDNPSDYKKIKLQYISLKDDVLICNCYLCHYYNLSCCICPLNYCGKGSVYKKFMTRPTTEKAIEIRDIIFKDNFI